MGLRQNGLETRRRLLEAACEVFAQRGYAAARVADICRRAGANVAAVNYYFGDKAALYVEAWKHALTECVEDDGLLAQDEPAEERLSRFIHRLLLGFLEKGLRGQFTRLYLMELANPTGLIQDSWREWIEPRRRRLLRIIAEITGGDPSHETVIFCEFSVVNQCRALLTVRRNDLEFLLGGPLTPERVRRLADHIARFSLAGIRAVAGREA